MTHACTHTSLLDVSGLMSVSLFVHIDAKGSRLGEGSDDKAHSILQMHTWMDGWVLRTCKELLLQLRTANQSRIETPIS
jgi:hypothetical protein